MSAWPRMQDATLDSAGLVRALARDDQEFAGHAIRLGDPAEMSLALAYWVAGAIRTLPPWRAQAVRHGLAGRDPAAAAVVDAMLGRARDRAEALIAAGDAEAVAWVLGEMLAVAVARLDEAQRQGGESFLAGMAARAREDGWADYDSGPLDG
jgi:hypothetical protein